MPELPEVETIRRGVERHLRGRVLDHVELHTARVARRETDLGAFARLGGRRILDVARRGKFLWMVLEGSDAALVIHLGMSGQLLHRTGAGAAGEPVRHAAATFHLDDDAALVFVDQRTFGYVSASLLSPTPDGLPAGAGTEIALIPLVAAHIARDPLDPYLDAGAASERMSRTSSAIKRVLLDQRYVSGIGNIYADETLWASRLHPEIPASMLGVERLAGVIGAAAEVMRSAVAAGGTSFDALYVDVEGGAGYFGRELAVYGQLGQPCRRCGTLVEKGVVGGRGTYACPTCQAWSAAETQHRDMNWQDW
ncbi:MAG TPA: bifunctional DNA-formamidopyrimidine glycosylase/DNA-(apurinic or apyrimidinic site) lyase [Actinomycetaceae bacterium]|nr:bifunctional DNA-formamidopyrimidine glycosylase/DNA-(apurinic or apyrimidinic site) lyase [Actinomycetaceae bacterium]